MPLRYGRVLEEEADGGGASGGGAGGGGVDAAAQAAADTAAAAAAAGGGGGGGGAPPPGGGGKTVVMPTAAVGRMKQEQRQLGKREAQTELEAKAKAAGYSSLDEALAAAAAAKNGGNGRQQHKPNDQRNGNQQRTNGNGASTNAQQPNGRRDQKTQQQLERERRQRIHAERKAKEALTERDAESARFSLERSAWNKGIRDTDYAITLLTRHCEGLSDEELSKFDEGTFFDGLRKSHSHLFGETSVPANTGVGGNGAPPAAKPDDVTRASGGNGAPDVRKMNKQDYEAHLRAKGLTPPTIGG